MSVTDKPAITDIPHPIGRGNRVFCFLSFPFFPPCSSCSRSLTFFAPDQLREVDPTTGADVVRYEFRYLVSFMDLKPEVREFFRRFSFSPAT
jgi:hypothetical protein